MLEELAQAEAVTRPCADAAVWAMPETQLIDALDAAHRLEQRLVALKLALVRELDGRSTATAQGATSTAVWLRDRLRLTVPAARRLVTLAAAVDAQPIALRRALADGLLDSEQARVIAETTATVRAQADPDAADQALDLLIDWAGQFDATLLRRLGTRILDHVAPDVADAATERALRADETTKDRDRHLTLSNLQDGRLRLTGSLDTETAALLRAAIDPLTKPSGHDDTRSPGQRRHDALTGLCRLALRTGDLPDHGGDPAQLVVTTTYDTLTRQLTAGTLDTGPALSPATVRRMACDAAILPAVLGSAGQVLDVGRQRRLITGPLRRALVLRDRGCAFPGCDRPPRWCEGHHLHHWSDGGTTSLTNAVLLCRHHHRQIHHHHWQVRLGTDGLPEFLPPAWLDPERRPRRNHCHRQAHEQARNSTTTTGTATTATTGTATTATTGTATTGTATTASVATAAATGRATTGSATTGNVTTVTTTAPAAAVATGRATTGSATTGSATGTATTGSVTTVATTAPAAAGRARALAATRSAARPPTRTRVASRPP